MKPFVLAGSLASHLAFLNPMGFKSKQRIRNASPEGTRTLLEFWPSFAVALVRVTLVACLALFLSSVALVPAVVAFVAVFVDLVVPLVWL